MKSTLLLVAALTGSLFTFSACNTEDDEISSQPGLPYQSNFQRDQDGWTAEIVDYGTAQDSIMEFKSGWKGLPAPLDTTRKSVMIESMNRSDDAFMYLKKKVTGLQPNKDYSLVFTIELASQYPENSMGIGGSPGGSVYLKAGATPVEPVKELKDGFYSLNIDKGQQIQGGKDAIVLGNIGTSGDTEGYKLITRSNTGTPFTARSNDKGELWLLVGTDSGFEGLTTLYYSKIQVSVK
ncbi:MULTISPECIES: hypothetical protein [Spirosoma]|uniref:Lipoprotein n=1 Tax=Spirosoma liriopis TaxID=2937440 RepID=A0ABT0HES7_9BACT|nr:MULTISPECIES: hypothetical protein [Spirosoma]MCK8490495.1 hypothetical protein [Spirosoma liriopis]UHG89864.1 hypothetical protein LQ777_16610 [Spirosoma oryzicola]